MSQEVRLRTERVTWRAVGIAVLVTAAGLKQVHPNFQAGIDWRTLFEHSRHLDILVSYARTGRNQHLEELPTFAGRAGTRIRLIVPDPRNDANMRALAQRYAIEPREVEERIEETIANGGTLYEFAIADLGKLFTNSARCRRIFPNP